LRLLADQRRPRRHGHLQPDQERQGRDRHLQQRAQLAPVDHVRDRRVPRPLLDPFLGSPSAPRRFGTMDTPDVLAWRDGSIEALDQTALPHRVRTLRITTVDQLVEAITTLAVRGAPVLGAARALGGARAAGGGGGGGGAPARLAAEARRTAAAGPPAVNLRREVTAVAGLIPQGRAAVEAAALAVVSSSVTASEQISRRGADWLR